MFRPPSDVPSATEIVENAVEGFRERMETVRLRKDQPVFQYDQDVNQCYIVRQGLLGEFRANYAGKQLLVQKYPRGESIGILQLLSSETFSGQVLPFKETVAYRISRSDFDVLVDQFPEEVTRLLLRSNLHMNRGYEKLENCVHLNLEQRVAWELLDFARYVGRRDEDGVRLIIPMSRRTISKFLGCAHESVIRVMSPWEKKGWIETEPPYVTIRKPIQLVRLIGDEHTRFPSPVSRP